MISIPAGQEAGQGGWTMIRPMLPEDVKNCVPAMIAAYNGVPWDNHWDEHTAARYLGEFHSHARATGFVDERDGRIAGAIFAHGKTWYTHDEVFVDELFVHRNYQGQGIGKALLGRMEEYCRENALAGVTLLTDQRMPSAEFYRRMGYSCVDSIVFYYKKA